MNKVLCQCASLLLTFALLLSAGPAASSDETAETVRWDRAPITLSLPVGKERYIWFPGRVQPGIPPELVKKLRVQAVNDTIYLKANAPFETTRLPIRDLTSGDFYLFDIQTSDDAATTPLRVVKVEGKDERALIDSETSQATAKESHGYVTLTRFAAQQIYAPKRLTKQLPGIFKVPLAADQTPMPGLYNDESIEATPIASWRGAGGLYVTAVNVANMTKTTTTLDPRLAQGSWLTATFHHRTLGPNGDPTDRSTLYLVSDRPFLEVVEQWLG